MGKYVGIVVFILVLSAAMAWWVTYGPIIMLELILGRKPTPEELEEIKRKQWDIPRNTTIWD